MRQLRVMLLTAVAALVAGCAGAHEGAAGAGGESSVRFVVMADNQPEGTATLGQPAVYKQIVREVNRLQPDLVIQVGDQISGYAADGELIHRMWDEFLAVRAGYTMPSYITPGNHDVWDERSEAIFKERAGKLYYSFNRGGSHFIVLDSEEPAYRAQITGAQLAWLERDLRAHRDAEHIFVFLHEPLWSYLDWQTYEVNQWNRDVHPLLKRYGVSAVFSGHEHIYAKAERDGVRYVITGGAGGPQREEPRPELGEFHHYCLVTVRDDAVSIQVIKPNDVGTAAEDVVLYDELPAVRSAQELWKLRARAWSLRREGRHLQAAEVWKQTVAGMEPPFGNQAATVFEEVEQDLRAAERLDLYAAFLAEQSGRFPGEQYAVWRDLALAAIGLDRGEDVKAMTLYGELLRKHPGDEAIVSRVYHDMAVRRHGAGLVKVEGEDFADQGGGKVRVADKVRASRKSFTGWDNPGHWLQWRFDVPREGTYYMIVRFAHGFLDGEGTHRQLTLDGEDIGTSFFWFTGGWASWADDWAYRLLMDSDGRPRRGLRLPAGAHTVRMEAPPGKLKGLNLDYILLVPAFDVPRP